MMMNILVSVVCWSVSPSTPSPAKHFLIHPKNIRIWYNYCIYVGYWCLVGISPDTQQKESYPNCNTLSLCLSDGCLLFELSQILRQLKFLLILQHWHFVCVCQWFRCLYETNQQFVDDWAKPFLLVEAHSNACCCLVGRGLFHRCFHSYFFCLGIT